MVVGMGTVTIQFLSLLAPVLVLCEANYFSVLVLVTILVDWEIYTPCSLKFVSVNSHDRYVFDF